VNCFMINMNQNGGNFDLYIIMGLLCYSTSVLFPVVFDTIGVLCCFYLGGKKVDAVSSLDTDL
jgi:hypothetical protein